MRFTNQPVVENKGNLYLLYDDSLSGHLNENWFDEAFWQATASINQAGLGRGSAWFISTAGEEYVLRHYRRGGLVSRISATRYIWTGLEKTRAWREWTLLAHLYGYQLPAPVPVAAMVRRFGLFYTASILIERIPQTSSLSEHLNDGMLADEIWTKVGETIARFHQCQVYHADLNAHNILISESDKIYIIDFDKGKIKSGAGWYTANLKRLHRSLTKLKMQSGDFHFRDQNWQSLMDGYQEQFQVN